MNLKNTLMIATLALMAGALGEYWLGHMQGEIRENRINEAQAREETERLEKALKTNRELQQQISELQVKKQKEDDEAKKKYDDLLARVNRGTVRVSIPARACSGVSVNGHATADGTETRAELDAETVGRLLAVGRAGDAAIQDLNQCIDQYNAVAKVHRPG